MLHSSFLTKIALMSGFFCWNLELFSAEPQRIFQGLDKGRPCFLYVHFENQIDDKNELSSYRVHVSTSYEHDGQGLGQVILEFTPEGEGKMLKWAHPNTEEFLLVQLKQPQTTLEDPNAFRIKWLHAGHFHDNICSELKKVN